MSLIPKGFFWSPSYDLRGPGANRGILLQRPALRRRRRGSCPGDRLKIEAALEARVGAPHRVASGGRGLTHIHGRSRWVCVPGSSELTWSMRPSSRCEPVGPTAGALSGAVVSAPALRSFGPLPSACALTLAGDQKAGRAGSERRSIFGGAKRRKKYSVVSPRNLPGTGVNRASHSARFLGMVGEFQGGKGRCPTRSCG